MNRQLMRQVAEAIEKFPQNFDMGSFYCEHEDDCECDDCHICQTTACIAGWAVLLDRGENKLRPGEQYRIDWGDEARKLLELTPNQADCLFMAYGNTWWVDTATTLGVLDEGHFTADATTVPPILRAVADGLVPMPTCDE